MQHVNYQESMSYAFIEACLNGTVDQLWLVMVAIVLTGRIGSIQPTVAAALLTADHYWDSRDDTDWKTKAVFGEVVWHATEKLDVTSVVVGLKPRTINCTSSIWRDTPTPKTTGRNVGGFIQPIWIGNDVTQSAKLSEFVPKLSLAYQIDDDKMVYALYSEGYRDGWHQPGQQEG